VPNSDSTKSFALRAAPKPWRLLRTEAARLIDQSTIPDLLKINLCVRFGQCQQSNAPYYSGLE